MPPNSESIPFRIAWYLNVSGYFFVLILFEFKRLQTITYESNRFITDYILRSVFTLQCRKERMNFDIIKTKRYE